MSDLLRDGDTSHLGTVILFHGMTGAPAEIADLADHLYSQYFSIFMPTLSGHAGSVEELKISTKKQWLDDADRAFRRGSEFEQKQVTRGKNLFVAGLSFGALLALSLAAKHPDAISGLIALSPPMRIRSRLKQTTLELLSFAPDWLLDQLGFVKKPERPPGTFAKPRTCYDVHSIGAAVRLTQIQRDLQRSLDKITCPLQLLYDPDDHHVPASAVEELASSVGSEVVDVVSFPGGQHELTLGHSYPEVYKKVSEFLHEQLCREK